MKTADLKKYAFDLLDLSRRFLSEDGDLDPTAFIVTADDQLLRTIDLTDEAHKVSSCEKIVQEARQRTALAIITIFLARFEDFNQKEFDSESYSWGEIQDKSSKRCILLSVSGPGVKNWAVALPFENIDGRFVFGGRVEFKGGLISVSSQGGQSRSRVQMRVEDREKFIAFSKCSNLVTPSNGSTTSGGAKQFQLKEPVKIDPTNLKKTDTGGA